MFYVQRRLGQFGREYRMFKIRTMVHDSEVSSGPVWASKRDHRITPIGGFLRDTHLDELPQLWNVVVGDMSLIGPRPERPELVEKIETAARHYRQRLQVPPGMTGLAQIELPADRDIEDVHRKLAFDLHYVRHVSLALDARVLFSTVFHILSLMADVISKRLTRCYRMEIAHGVVRAKEKDSEQELSEVWNDLDVEQAL